jgi:hypothetical protein
MQALAAGGRCAGDEYEEFRSRVAPIFEQRCLSCHSGSQPQGGLSLETRNLALAGSDGGAAILPGDADKSFLLDYIQGDDPQMPQDGPPLAAYDVEAIRAWIARGAPWPDDAKLVDRKAISKEWWSLKPLVRTELPEINSTWIRNPIDAFVLHKLQALGMQSAEEADRRTLLRRLSFDLTGLPPTFEETEAFVDDPDPQAYENLVRRLLASPRYGERWARHWLDVVHYADTHGFDKDKVRPNAWPYRDYVIRSFNDDKPYARFVEEQVAGDYLYPGTADGVSATGFLVAGPFDYVGQIEVAEGTLSKAITRNLDRDDMVGVTINTFNSMTVQCARCHDHKFDPVTQEDYYALQAVFAGIDRADRPYPASQVQSVALESAGGELAPPASEGVVYAAATEFPPEAAFTPTHGKPRQVYVLKRGSEAHPGELAAPHAPGYIAEAAPHFTLGDVDNEGERRAGLARWLVDPGNPLTWRSIVNRVWLYHFGSGIVDTPNDFGRMGSTPTHPELLDWLAMEFRDGGPWLARPQSLKELHYLLCTSATYRQSSHDNADNASRDAGNRYLWRMNRRKLEAEEFRDAVLMTAGKLDLAMGGPGYRNFQFVDDHSPHYNYEDFDNDDPGTFRRSIYRQIVRSVPDPWMATLDCADSSTSVPKRSETLTALQALSLLNNGFMVGMASGFKQRIERECEAEELIRGDLEESPSLVRQVSKAWRLALAREPAKEELRIAAEYAEVHGLANACRMIFNLNEFMFID